MAPEDGPNIPRAQAELVEALPHPPFDRLRVSAQEVPSKKKPAPDVRSGPFQTKVPIRSELATDGQAIGARLTEEGAVQLA